MQIEGHFGEEYFLEALDFVERRFMSVKYSETTNCVEQTGEERSGRGCNATMMLLSGLGCPAHPACPISLQELQRFRVLEVGLKLP